MEPRLWVPLIHVLVARNWNWASSRSSLTTLIVAKRASVSTPLRGLASVMLIGVAFLWSLWSRGRQPCDRPHPPRRSPLWMLHGGRRVRPRRLPSQPPPLGGGHELGSVVVGGD